MHDGGSDFIHFVSRVLETHIECIMVYNMMGAGKGCSLNFRKTFLVSFRRNDFSHEYTITQKFLKV